MKERISITLDNELLRWLDSKVSNKTFANRSHGFEFLIHQYRKKGADSDESSSNKNETCSDDLKSNSPKKIFDFHERMKSHFEKHHSKKKAKSRFLKKNSDKKGDRDFSFNKKKFNENNDSKK